MSKYPSNSYIIFLRRDGGRHIVGYGLMSYIALLLSHGVGCNFAPKENRNACHRMMQFMARHVASKLMAAVRDKAANQAKELCASGQCAAALEKASLAISLGDSPSLALKAWLHIRGREGVAKDEDTAFALAEEGARLGCHHCQGVLAYCNWRGFGIRRDDARSLELARKSSGRGSRYGQYTLGDLHYWGRGGLAEDEAQAVAFYRLAAAQGLDEAQWSLGCMCCHGVGVAEEYAEALRLYQLAAAQGHPAALYNVALCHEHGYGVATDVVEAISWYMRAQAAGYPDADVKVLRLRHK